MTIGDSIGGILGAVLVVGVLGKGIEKIDKALSSDEKSKSKSFLEDTEPFS